MNIALGIIAAIGLAIFFVGCATKYRDDTPPPPRPYIIQKADSGRWVWQIVSRNNQLLAESEQDFGDAVAALDNFIQTREAIEGDADPQIMHGTTL